MNRIISSHYSPCRFETALGKIKPRKRTQPIQPPRRPSFPNPGREGGWQGGGGIGVRSAGFGEGQGARAGLGLCCFPCTSVCIFVCVCMCVCVCLPLVSSALSPATHPPSALVLPALASAEVAAETPQLSVETLSLFWQMVKHAFSQLVSHSSSQYHVSLWQWHVDSRAPDRCQKLVGCSSKLTF